MIIRQAELEDAASIARVRIDTWRTTYRGIVPAEFLDSMPYEALGGELVKTSQFEIAGVSIDEVAYGWLDIRTILKEQR